MDMRNLMMNTDCYNAESCMDKVVNIQLIEWYKDIRFFVPNKSVSGFTGCNREHRIQQTLYPIPDRYQRPIPKLFIYSLFM